MFGLLTRLFDENARNLKRFEKVVAEITALEPQMKKLSDAKLAAQTKKFKALIAEGKDAGRTDDAILNEILPEAFATVREVSRRVLGMRHFDVQLLAGLALHHGMVAEQKTGEGKTLTVTAPLYLNALLGKGAHLVTVNDYLAELGAGWMGNIYHFLGLSTAVIVHDQAKRVNPAVESEERGDERLEHFEAISRQEAYAADITYGTNNEFGFDYLRDNMVQDIRQMVQRSDTAHQFAIVDEADSILIDEARTPLIISAPDSEPTKKYYDFAQMVKALTRDTDFKLDEKARTVTLTDLGIKRIEQKLGIHNLYEENYDTIHQVETALKAKTLYHRDKEYIVREQQVIIVDEHTGRLMFGRRYSDGLHQAIEAKEGAPIQQESRTLATISLQNYFRMYHKLAGMSGTVMTEAEEFRKIYDMTATAIPTNAQVRRMDQADIVYKTAAVKYSAIAHDVSQLNSTGQPVLIGTRSIHHNQIVSDLLTRTGIEHQVLNAKNHEQEAHIIANAGKKGAVTVATNIAGRGVDIVLGGAKPELKEFRKQRVAKTTTKTKAAIPDGVDLPPSIDPAQYDLKGYAKALATWNKAHEAVVSLGGLYIIGAERHESRRIDHQLRGRSGRQGDPGASQFYVALDDEIMRIFGGDKIAKLMEMLKIDETQPIEHGLLGKAIENAQVKVEGFFFDQRKRLVEFDDVMNKQREVVYQRRRRILNLGQSDDRTALKETILEQVDGELSALVLARASQGINETEMESLVKEFVAIVPFEAKSQKELVNMLTQQSSSEAILERLQEITSKAYAAREASFGPAIARELEQFVLLTSIDEQWMDHLDAMDNLRDGIWLRGDKNMVLSEYKKEAFGMFEKLMGQIGTSVAHKLFRVQPLSAPPARQQQMIEIKADASADLAKTIAQDPSVQAPSTPASQQGKAGDLAAAMRALSPKNELPKIDPGSAKVKIGRNDPCPCGSGKKYKKCHGKLAGDAE
jgi:preprotein translocase subunit SecA